MSKLNFFQMGCKTSVLLGLAKDLVAVNEGKDWEDIYSAKCAEHFQSNLKSKIWTGSQ